MADHVELFGESPSRVVACVAPELLTEVTAVAEAEARLGETGRVLLRPSGTEPVVRVMVEAPDEETAGREAQVLADVVQRELRLHD